MVDDGLNKLCRYTAGRPLAPIATEVMDVMVIV